MHIRELMSLTGMPERQIRYLISEGFMPSPTGGRAHADYGEEHVSAIQRYQRLKELGFPPAAIKVLLAAKEGIPFPVGKGEVSLIVDPSLLGSGADPEAFIAEISKLLKSLLEEKQS